MPRLQPQYRLLAASCPLPIFGGTGTMPWYLLSHRATKMWMVFRELSKEALFLTAAVLIILPVFFAGSFGFGRTAQQSKTEQYYAGKGNFQAE